MVISIKVIGVQTTEIIHVVTRKIILVCTLIVNDRQI